MGRLNGKTAIVIGAAGKGNMGQAIARRFAQEGAVVLAAGRHEDELKRFAGEIGGRYAVCDLTRRADNFALAEDAVRQMGRIDIAVNATGSGAGQPFLDETEDAIRAMIDLQLVGPIFFYQAMLGAMTNGGSLIQISSATTQALIDNFDAYIATKAATDQLMRLLANQFGARGVRANSISPGLTRTAMSEGAFSLPGVVEAFEACYPLGRVGTVEDIAAAAVWLSQDDCFMTGQNLQVNGGLTLRRNPTGAEIGASIAKAQAG